ncbi:MAG: orotidine-5'-phosphate decarboxylase [Candidatus Nomurabacteria bacterium]|nr:orotidine-5'-phosphate decarboxylase [Candidatus Nomurabacteria bacterium]
MKELTFLEKLELGFEQKKYVCVGLDTDYSKMPDAIRRSCVGIENRMFSFNRNIIDKTKDLVLAYKPNFAFYLDQGVEGLKALEKTVAYMRNVAPNVVIILDVKWGDIGNTNNPYKKFAFETLKVDAVTVAPYMGYKAMKPFLDYKDKGIIVLCKTSNEGADEFQDFSVMPENGSSSILYEEVARNVSNPEKWNYNGNCLLVVGATAPEDELYDIRRIVGDMNILVPGIGEQGGDLKKVVKNGLNSKGHGLIINSSRGIIFASKEDDFALKAREKTIELNQQILKEIEDLKEKVNEF